MNLQGAPRQGTAKEVGTRRLGWALVASAAIHLLVLWPAALPQPSPQSARPLAATLRPVIASPILSAAPEPAAPRSATKPASSPNHSVRSHGTATARRAMPEPRTAPVIASPVPERTVMSGSGAYSPTTDITTLSVSSGAAGGSDEGGVDPDALRQFRFAVSRAAHPDYPRLAVERGWSGTAQIRVTVGTEAAVRGIRLARSSGYALLDAKAEEIIGRAARAAAIPESLRGREFVVDLPVEFNLESRIEGE